VNQAPNKPLAPIEREFIKMVLSKQGQEVVVKDGYVPVPKKVADKALASIK
jgi:phosphate transport system substrate-binding protein